MDTVLVGPPFTFTIALFHHEIQIQPGGDALLGEQMLLHDCSTQLLQVFQLRELSHSNHHLFPSSQGSALELCY